MEDRRWQRGPACEIAAPNFELRASNKATVTISCSSANAIRNGIAPLPFPLPALLKQCWCTKRGERVRVHCHCIKRTARDFERGLSSARVPVCDRCLDILQARRHSLRSCGINPALHCRRSADFSPQGCRFAIGVWIFSRPVDSPCVPAG